ncbi:MAG TPA: cytochrome c biogenesis heme-transporting ATPase CcmA [Pseudomonadales bacterium]|nr:cytochrome c biogenesis heme-transporting ATPase CcmA [Pseudomonadales bacterium]
MDAIKLQLCDIRCEKGYETLFDGVGCVLKSGELLHVAGENGSGKTTLLRVIAGLNRHYEGELRWCDENVRHCWPHYASQLLYLGHQPALKARLTARENLAWYAQCANADPDIVPAALADLGLRGKSDLPVHQLSAGQQRRVVLARLYFSPQKLWVLDEPFTAIDANGFAPILNCMRGHLSRGGMIVLTTHHGIEKIDITHQTLLLSKVNGVAK